MEKEVYYRADTYYTHDSLCVYLEMFPVIRRTPKGVWLATRGFLGREETFVANSWHKKFAYPTKELALESLKIRARKHAKYAKARAVKAETRSQAVERVTADSFKEGGARVVKAPLAYVVNELSFHIRGVR